MFGDHCNSIHMCTAGVKYSESCQLFQCEDARSVGGGHIALMVIEGVICLTLIP